MRTLADRMTSSTRKRGRRYTAEDNLQNRQDEISPTRGAFPTVPNRSSGRSVYSTAEDLMSISTNITIETTRTSYNENRKPIPSFSQIHEHGHKQSHQIFCNSMNALQNLKSAHNDIVATQIYLKELTIDKSICSAFLALIRGDNKSWESMAVDILRQKARWESITFEECGNSSTKLKNRASRAILPQNQTQDQYLEVCISFIISLDNCAHLHLSNLILQQTFTLQSLTFSKHLVKLQFDLMDLGPTIDTLCDCLTQNTSLEILIASRCGLVDDQLAALFGALPDQLLEIRVFGNKCRTQGLAAASMLIQDHKYLQILDLSYQHLPKKDRNGPPPKEEDDFNISWLMAALMTNDTLLTLDLDNTAVDDDDLRHIINALCENSTLEELMLNHNFITNEGVAMLSARFDKMQGLKKLSMYSNLFELQNTAPPTEITAPSVTSRTPTVSHGNKIPIATTNANAPTVHIPYHQNHIHGEDDSDYETDDDDKTINTAVSSLADETVFREMMEGNPKDLPVVGYEELPQAPYPFQHNKTPEKYKGGNEQLQYFNDGQDYDESVCATEYEEVSVFTSTDYPAAETEDRVSDLAYETSEAVQGIPDAEFVRSNTTTF
jgi:hypothetical protein